MNRVLCLFLVHYVCVMCLLRSDFGHVLHDVYLVRLLYAPFCMADGRRAETFLCISCTYWFGGLFCLFVVLGMAQCLSG